MNLFQVEDFFKSTYPGKNISLDFPKECHRQYEIMMTDGKPNPHHHIECRHVMVTVEGMSPMKVPIAPHRMTPTHKEMMDLLKSSLHIG